MISFRSFLIEYLTDVQRQHFSQYKMSDKARADTDHFFGAGNDKVTGDLDHMTDKSEIHRKIEKHLGKEISHDDYRAGLTTDNYGRDVKIGRAIKDDKLRAEYAKDPTREGARASSQYTTSTVRGVEVAGQTNPSRNKQHPNGHSWKDLSAKMLDLESKDTYCPTRSTTEQSFTLFMIVMGRKSTEQHFNLITMTKAMLHMQ